MTQFQHIDFADRTPTAYSTDESAKAVPTLKMAVDKSASFLLLPLDPPQAVHSVRFEWRTEGDLNVHDAATQQRREGDDARLRLGLVFAGKAPLIPFFAPAWVKAVRDRLRHPAGDVLFLLVGTPVAGGVAWSSPYGDDLRLVAVDSQPLSAGWQAANFSLMNLKGVSGGKAGQERRLVAVWLMADGDDTGSRFTTWLRRLAID